ncbi:MAG: DUF1559 domain-containing protein, partial [Planctomycetales bacterium]|nr:DUF1559 domain-containing protein [Planctomycetales bacterium]
EEKKNAISAQLSHAVAAFICPTRRPADPYPSLDNSGAPNQPPHNANPSPAGLYAKTDYCANGGLNSIGINQGPSELCYSLYPRCLDFNAQPAAVAQICNGVVCYRMGIKLRQISDGSSKTALCVEKYLSADRYLTGDHDGDDNTAYTGYDVDTIRFLNVQPLQDKPFGAPGDNKKAAGSAHPGIVQAALCDGSVQSFNLDVEKYVWTNLASRNNEESSNRADKWTGNEQ